MLALEAWRDHDVFMPVTAIVSQLFTRSCNTGGADLDSAAAGRLNGTLSGL